MPDASVRCHRPRNAGRRTATVLLLALGAMSCGDEGAGAPPPPAGPPYIAIVARLDAAPGVSAGERYTYRIRERSGTLGIDTTIVTQAPSDTVILSVPNETAQYDVELSGVPSKCASRYGLAQGLTVPANTNTSIVRFFIICKPLVVLTALREGTARDDELLFRLTGPGVDRVGSIRWPALVPDTSSVVSQLLEDLAPGDYELALADLAPNCTVTSQGLRRLRFTVPSDGGVTLSLRMACSDEARRPRLLTAHATYRGTTTAVTFTAVDPDRDIDWYYWDVTDCRGYSVLKAGQLSRRGVVTARGYRDTVQAAAVFDVAADTASLAGRCAALRVWDGAGNTTPISEVPLVPTVAGPAVRSFNALLPGAQTSLDVSIAIEGTFFAIFPTIRVRDGVLGAADGVPDVGIYNVAGYLTTTLPPVPLGGRLQWYDVLASEVYVLDAAGNFTVVRDEQLSR